MYLRNASAQGLLLKAGAPGACGMMNDRCVDMHAAPPKMCGYSQMA